MRETIVKLLKRHTTDGTVPEPDVDLFQDGYLDSFALADMVADVEKEFAIKIPDSDLKPKNFASINRIEEYLTGKV